MAGGKVAWITGGGSGIGQAGAEALAREGWTVIVSGRRREALDQVVRGIGDRAEALALDVSDNAAVEAAARDILARHGRIDCLVNSAGLNVPKRSWSDFSFEGWDTVVEINLNGVLYCMRAVLPAMRAQQDGCIINVSSWAGRHVSKMTGPAYTATKHAVLALTHSFNMDECVHGLRACCLMPGEVATPILKNRPVPPSAEEQARMLQPEDLGRTIAFIATMPKHVCINELLISPTWNRSFVAAPRRRPASSSFARCEAQRTESLFQSFSLRQKRFPETALKRRRSSRNAAAMSCSLAASCKAPAMVAGEGRWSMSKKIALFSAAAIGALAITASAFAPAQAEDKKMMKSEMSGEKTVMVGGAAMYPSKNIVQNAVNSKDHTTLVAAVKAAGLVETLEGKGPFTVFAPTNAAFGKLPAGTVDTLVKPENKKTLTKILTYHVVAGKLNAADLKDGQKLKTVAGEELTVKASGGKVMVMDAKGGSSTVTIADVNQSNGVIHVIDTVLMPAS